MDLKMIRYLYHISDIHVRMYSRHEEYRHVFSNLYQILKSKAPGAIVITGDVLHNKIDLTPECCILVYEFLKTLGEIMPVIVIAGNHDALLNNRHRVDSLTSILHDRTPDNVFYFPNTGVYAFDNLVLVINSLLDDSPWIVPDQAVSDDDSEPIIALYHGQVGQWINHSGFKSQTFDKNVTDFRGADLVLLGDIHKHQYMDENKTIGYAGSLISQNFTETDDDHGVLIWDVVSKTSQLIRIENPYAFKQIAFDGKHLWMDEVSYEPKNILLPCQGSIRIHMSLDHDRNRNLLVMLAKRFPLVRFQTVYEKTDPSVIVNSDYYVDELTDIQEYIFRHCKDCEHRDTIAHELCQYYQDYITTKNETADWHLLSLYFDDMFGYGKANRIEFADFPMHTVTGIFGKNSTGKSTLIDIIIFMLYGKITRSVSGNSIPKEIIHCDESKSYGEIRIQIGKHVYQITKQCLRQKNDKIKIVERLFEIRGDHIIELTDEQRRRTDKLIAEKIGNMDSFLFTNVMLQQREKSFREMTQANKKDFLYHLFHLDGFERLRKEKEDEMKKSKVRIDMCHKQMQGCTENEYRQDLLTLDKRQACLQEEMLVLDGSIETITQQIEELLTSIVPIVPKMDLAIIEEKISVELSTINRLRQEIDQVESVLQSMDISAKRDSLKRLEAMVIKPSVSSFMDETVVDRFGPQDPSNTHEKWCIEYERVMGCIRDFDTIKTKWFQKNEEYETQLRLLREQRPNVRGTCVPEEEWLRHMRTYDPDKIHALTREKEQLIVEHKQIDEDVLERHETRLREIGALCSEWKIHESLYLMQSQTFKEDQEIRYNPECSECMNNPYYLKKHNLEERLRHLKKEKDALESHIQECMAEIWVGDIRNMCVVDVYERLHADFIEKRNKFTTQKKRLQIIFEELERAEKEKNWTDTQEMLRLQKKMDIKITKLLKNQSTDECKKKYDEILAMINLVPSYQEMNRLWGASEHQLQRLKDDIRVYEETLLKKRNLQGQLEARQRAYQDAQMERADIVKTIEHHKKNQVLHKEIAVLRERKHNLQTKLAGITDEMKAITHRIQQTNAALDNLSKLQKEWLQHIEDHKILSKTVSIIERDGLPLYLLSKKIPHIEADINMIVRPFMDKTICFQIHEKDIVLGSKSNMASSGFYGGMEAFIIDVALKISFGRFGKLPRSDFFIIDEGVSVIDQEKIINLSNLFDFLLSFNERVYIMSHLPIVKDFVQNRIEIDKDEKSGKSSLQIFF